MNDHVTSLTLPIIKDLGINLPEELKFDPKSATPSINNRTPKDLSHTKSVSSVEVNEMHYKFIELLDKMEQLGKKVKV